jgi:iron-sulfur cluster repair protein YtfE (RIC family)
MEDVLGLIDRIIEEHKTIIGRLKTLEQVANDAEAIVGFDKAKQVFMPGRLERKEGLQELEELLDKISRGIRAHFKREETALLIAFERYGDKNMASSLRSLLLEHDDLRNRIAHTKKHVAQLTGGKLSRQVWEATAYDIRAHISHTKKLMEAHAEIEKELLLTLRKQLTREVRK